MTELTERESGSRQSAGLLDGPEPEQKNWRYTEMENQPDVVLSLLEPDQLVSVKERTPFRLRNLSVGTRLQLWGLRIYVVVMMFIVVLSVSRAIQVGH